jgi:hypothetical protein
MNMIDSYSFGNIVIDGKKYTKDVIIYPDGRIQGSWWRKKGHKLCVEDIADLIDYAPELIIAGTGAYGIMKPEVGFAELLYDKGIEFQALPSGNAVKEYNRLCGEKKIGACFHLTC